MEKKNGSLKSEKWASKEAIESSIEEWVDDPELHDDVSAHLSAMREARKKDAKINARVNSVDLDGFKAIAAEKRMPYQTMLGDMIHFARLGDMESLTAMFKPSQKRRKRA